MARTKPIVKEIGEVSFVFTDDYHNKRIKVSEEITKGSIKITIDFTPSRGIETKPTTLELRRDGSSSVYKRVVSPDHIFLFDFPMSDLDFIRYTFFVYTNDSITADDDESSQLSGDIGQLEFEIVPQTEVNTVRLARPGFEETADKELWNAIRSNSLNFREYSAFISKIMCERDDTIIYDDGIFGKGKRKGAMNRSPFIGAKQYNLLKFGTEFYMLSRSTLNPDDIRGYLSGHNTFPYYESISDSLEEIEKEYKHGDCEKVKKQRLKTPFFIELIWSYWMEQGMLVQTMNLICLRFQNIDNGNLGPLARLDLNPLRILSQLFWDYIQDQQHHLSLPRRVREYDHEYGLTLQGRAVPAFVPADSRSKFLEAFHSLLTTASIFFKEADDTTRIADAFPVLNSLKEVHLLLAEGNHNAYGNLTWTARHEMLMTQYIISQEETRIFLGGRPMVPYPENWMDRIDTVRNMMGWGSTSITYFYDLAIHGEKILLAIRYGNWSDANMPAASAANWAIAFRDSIQKYIHGYRTVTGVDLSADSNTNNATRSIQPSALIQRRVAEERARLRRA